MDRAGKGVHPAGVAEVGPHPGRDPVVVGTREAQQQRFGVDADERRRGQAAGEAYDEGTGSAAKVYDDRGVDTGQCGGDGVGDDGEAFLPLGDVALLLALPAFDPLGGHIRIDDCVRGRFCHRDPRNCRFGVGQ